MKKSVFHMINGTEVTVPRSEENNLMMANKEAAKTFTDCYVRSALSGHNEGVTVHIDFKNVCFVMDVIEEEQSSGIGDVITFR